MSASRTIKLLTQAEVAIILRRGVKSVSRLRTSGELGYLPGSPVMIPESEVDAYLQRAIVKQRVDVAEKAKAADQAKQDKVTRAIANLRRRGQLEGIPRPSPQMLAKAREILRRVD